MSIKHVSIFHISARWLHLLQYIPFSVNFHVAFYAQLFQLIAFQEPFEQWSLLAFPWLLNLIILPCNLVYDSVPYAALAYHFSVHFPLSAYFLKFIYGFSDRASVPFLLSFV